MGPAANAGPIGVPSRAHEADRPGRDDQADGKQVKYVRPSAAVNTRKASRYPVASVSLTLSLNGLKCPNPDSIDPPGC